MHFIRVSKQFNDILQSAVIEKSVWFEKRRKILSKYHSLSTVASVQTKSMQIDANLHWHKCVQITVSCQTLFFSTNRHSTNQSLRTIEKLEQIKTTNTNKTTCVGLWWNFCETTNVEHNVVDDFMLNNVVIKKKTNNNNFAVVFRHGHRKMKFNGEV